MALLQGEGGANDMRKKPAMNKDKGIALSAAWKDIAEEEYKI